MYPTQPFLGYSSCLVPRLYPSHGPLRFIMITSHSLRARLCHVKNEAPEEEAGTVARAKRERV